MKFLSLLSSLLTIAPYVLSAPAPANLTASRLTARGPSSAKTVIIQMFEWSWDSVASECTDFIGPAGYGYVQDYQPVSYILTSKRGNRAQFQNMINTCHSAGVDVIVGTYCITSFFQGIISSWVSPQNSRIAFGRGSTGFVAINTDAGTWSATFMTSLPDGTYCNVINGKKSAGSCTGSTITLSGGRFTATVNGRDAIAIHTGAMGSGGSPISSSASSVTSVLPSSTPGSVSVTFEHYATTSFVQNIFVVGSIPALGSWTAVNSIALSSNSYPTWKVTVGLPAGTAFEYKFIRKNEDETATWESYPNRQVTTVSSGSQVISGSWR